MRPLISVIMPAYNAENYIAEAIRSILEQTYENLELIIVEDCSSDGTLDVIKQFYDTRITLIENEENHGVAYSTNRAIQSAKGKYLALLDDDDIAIKDRLELQVNYLEEHSEISVLGGRAQYIDEFGRVFREDGERKHNPRYIKSMLLLNAVGFCNGTVMMRRTFFIENELWYKEHCYGMQDHRFYIEASKYGNISTVDQFLLQYRVHDKNETSKNMNIFWEERAKTYAQFQRDSLELSGFQLKEEYLWVINKVIAERSGRCDSAKEFQLLYEGLAEIVRQGREMSVEYIAELEIHMKVLLAEKIRHSNIFEQ